MDAAEAIAFLEAHQPMGPDLELSQEEIDGWDAATRALTGSTDPRVPSLILTSFGEGDGLGTYQLVDDVLRSLPRDGVIEALLPALRSEHGSVRSWSMEMAMDFPDSSLVGEAVRLMEAPPRSDWDEDAATYAAYFLTFFDSHDASTMERIRHAAEHHHDADAREALREWLAHGNALGRRSP